MKPMVPIVYRRQMMGAPIRAFRPSGMSIAEIIRSAIDPALYELFFKRGVVTIDRLDGRGASEIPRGAWDHVRPRTDGPVAIEVNLYLPPADDGTKSILAIVATIAVVVAAAIIAGPIGISFFASLGLSTALATAAAATAGAAVALAGSLAIKALTPPPSVSALSSGDATGGTPKNPASLSGNVLQRSVIIPHTRGRRKMFPPYVVKPLVELVGDSEYATGVVALSGAHDFQNLKADGVDFDKLVELGGFEYEIREGHDDDELITLVDRQSTTDVSVITLSQHEVQVDDTNALKDQTTPSESAPRWHAMQADGSPDEIWINLRWPTGLFDGDNSALQMVTPVRVRIRRRGDTAWIRLPEVHFAYRKQEPFQKDIRIIWGTAPTAPTPKVDRAPYAAYAAVVQRIKEGGSVTEIGDFTPTDLENLSDHNDASPAVKSGTTAFGYIGFRDDTHPRKAIKSTVGGNSSTGFSGATDVTIEWWGKSTPGAPASSTDGTLLASSGSIVDTTNLVELTSGDQTTDFYSQWMKIIGSTSSSYALRRWDLFDDGDWSWLSDSSFYTTIANSPAIWVMRDTTIGTTVVRNTLLYEDRVEYYLDSNTHPKGDYEVEIMRGAVVDQAAFDELTYTVSGDTTSADLFKWKYFSPANEYEVPRDLSNVQYQMQRTRLSLIWNEHPLSDAPGKLALIAVKVKDRQISQISVDAALYVLDWDGSDWTTLSTTANPASHLRDIWTGPLNADPLPEELVDNDSLVAWHGRCETDGFEVNAVAEGLTVDIASRLVAGCGYARIGQSETFRVIEDKDRSAESPSQTFTTRNMSAYHFDKQFVRKPSGFRCIYYDVNTDYKETEILVDDPDGDGLGRYEEMRYDGFVTEAEVQARALFDLKQGRLRMAFHILDSNAQAIKSQRGDLIGLASPVLEKHMGAGYVQEVLTGSGDDVTGLVLDGSVPVFGDDEFFSGPDDFIDDLYSDGFFGSLPMGAVVRLHDDEPELTAEIVTVATPDNPRSRVLTFSTPIPGPITGLDRECLVVVGSLGEERLRLILAEIVPKSGAGQPVTLVAVDEAPELWQ